MPTKLDLFVAPRTIQIILLGVIEPLQILEAIFAFT